MLDSGTAVVQGMASSNPTLDLRRLGEEANKPGSVKQLLGWWREEMICAADDSMDVFWQLSVCIGAADVEQPQSSIFDIGELRTTMLIVSSLS